MPDEISPEDREMLAKTKYKEWFKECFTEMFPEEFDRRVTETHKAASGKTGQPAPGSPPQPESNSVKKAKRRSLLEECLSSSLGWG